jgi:hypothetical protein
MTKKAAAPLIRFTTPAPAQEHATRNLKRAVERKRKLYVEVPESFHRAVRFKALDIRKTVAEYILELLETKKGEALSVAPFPAAAGEKRIVLDLPAARAEQVQAMAEPFGGFRQMVLACLEKDGIQFPRTALDELLHQAGTAAVKFAAEQYGEVPNEDAARAAWLFFCRLNGKNEQYQLDESNFRPFFAASTRAARETLKGTGKE